MRHCCDGSSGSNKGDGRFKWWGFGGFVAILILLAVFDGNPLVSQMAPLILLGLILLWLAVVLVARTKGLKR